MSGAFTVKALEDKLGEFGDLLAVMTGIGWFKTIGESVIRPQ